MDEEDLVDVRRGEGKCPVDTGRLWIYARPFVEKGMGMFETQLRWQDHFSRIQCSGANTYSFGKVAGLLAVQWEAIF